MDYTTLLFLDCRSTAWEKPADQPAGQHTEITRVDIAVVDTRKNQITEQEIFYVKPAKSTISAYCERLFGVKQSTVDAKGVPFEELYRYLRIHHMSRDRFWAGWGTYDKYVIDKQCKLLGLENLFTQLHHNVQHMFALMSGDKEATPDLEDALKYCEIASTDNYAFDIANIYTRMAKGLRPSPTKTRLVVPGHFRQN
jgi:inhibitor of KinA sporulation pathway (predicted exonuclease)